MLLNPEYTYLFKKYMYDSYMSVLDIYCVHGYTFYENNKKVWVWFLYKTFTRSHIHENLLMQHIALTLPKK